MLCGRYFRKIKGEEGLYLLVKTAVSLLRHALAADIASVNNKVSVDLRLRWFVLLSFFSTMKVAWAASYNGVLEEKLCFFFFFISLHTLPLTPV